MADLSSYIVCLGLINYGSEKRHMRRNEEDPRTLIPSGTLYMLILKTLAQLGPMHGYGIAQYIQQSSEGVLQVEEGTLYPALQRMLIKGWVKDEWEQTENNRRARYYHLPPQGRKQLSAEINDYQRIIEAISRIVLPPKTRRGMAWRTMAQIPSAF
jgi:PadR family transcriptional regulator PadR